ncbi:Ferredoxin subunit of nitrite reductase or a ring-hydroxylating dioxygenase [Natronorubrum sediminis]|uniref:Ferredoxin subunit of nitrite reductase or a ring-hydroxylating dioxygenase n=1 Tax=Natronorubrum sediminis TaxID=640943 RepID=A0A1H6FZM0_9EURY|nr:Rieske (2Fe-2S) protein [Natronorubrum sediminis]SEH15648.1 Ferredoxin subunit of nitrite reductase or a ring-hydroxylating dioxygenase [Natronorubrum sediminis]
MSGTPTKRHVVAEADEIADGERVVTQLEGREIAVFHQDGEYYAYLNWCAHQGGPCGEGPLTGTEIASYDRESGDVERSWEREGEILNCPWHGWEYDLTSGDCLSRNGITLPSYQVEIEDGKIVVEL